MFLIFNIFKNCSYYYREEFFPHYFGMEMEKIFKLLKY